MELLRRYLISQPPSFVGLNPSCTNPQGHITWPERRLYDLVPRIAIKGDNEELMVDGMPGRPALSRVGVLCVSPHLMEPTSPCLDTFVCVKSPLERTSCRYSFWFTDFSIEPENEFLKIATWLILPEVIRSSQRLSHACLSISINTSKLRMAHYISYSLFDNPLLLGYL
jgi:hypothetical protein